MLSGLQKLPVQTQKSVQSPRLVFLANYGIVQVDRPDNEHRPSEQKSEGVRFTRFNTYFCSMN